MTGRQWAPGDVAMVRDEDGLTHRAIVISTVGDGLHVVVPTYALEHEMDANQRLFFGDGAISRPATIDLESREDVERLVECYRGHWGKAERVADALQDALREFANPIVKPEEPTSLVARVVDGDGDEWARRTDGWWACLTNRSAEPVQWSTLLDLAGPAVEVTP